MLTLYEFLWISHSLLRRQITISTRSKSPKCSVCHSPFGMSMLILSIKTYVQLNTNPRVRHMGNIATKFSIKKTKICLFDKDFSNSVCSMQPGAATISITWNSRLNERIPIVRILHRFSPLVFFFSLLLCCFISIRTTKTKFNSVSIFNVCCMCMQLGGWMKRISLDRSFGKFN